VSAPSHDAPSDPVAIAALLAGLDPLVRFPDRGDLGPVGEAVWVRLDARLTETLELGPPLGEQVGPRAFWPLVHDGEPIAG
jgi:hypothetical protein